MKTHSLLRSAVALVALAFVTGLAHAKPVANQSVLKAVPEKLIGPALDTTSVALESSLINYSVSADVFAAIATAPDNKTAIAPNKALMVNSKITATAANTANVRFKEAVDVPQGASQKVTSANFASFAANYDAWAADPPATG